ncbi:unnamed protein product [Closterium sp. NIES-65]|nr:unnamed protein product [Closterium sp. NIES-65]
MPSQDSILGASPLMDPRFAMMFAPSVNGNDSQYLGPTVAALSLPHTLEFVLDSGATDSVFCDAGVLRSFPVPSIQGAGDTMYMTCTATSSLPCPAYPSGAVTGLYVPSCRHNLLSLSALQRLCMQAIFPECDSYCDLYHRNRHLARFTLSPINRLYTLCVSLPSSAHHASSACAPLVPSCECRSLVQPTLLLRHRLGHPDSPLLRSQTLPVTSSLFSLCLSPTP